MSRSAAAAEALSVSAAEARALFASYVRLPCLAIAVSGGPDSLALLWLMVRWRAARKNGPRLIAFTVDHGLRPEARSEARSVARVAAQLGVPHRVLHWRGPKPAAGLQEAAREARYRLMIDAATKAGAAHLVLAHTQDDQAETILQRMARGSGLSGLAAMRPQRARGEITLLRPLLGLSKARLMATLRQADLTPADDPSNRDPKFSRVRWRGLMPQLAAEGLDAARLSTLADRLARADAALEGVVDTAARDLVRSSADGAAVLDQTAFVALADEVALRLLGRLIAQIGREGPVELAKLEAMLVAVHDHASGPKAAARFKRTLAGASVTLAQGRVSIAPTPPRRAAKADRRSDSPRQAGPQH